MLDLDRLRALHAVANHGSVRAAAAALHLTTSAVSQQLTKLERETQAKLLERHGRGVRLTDAARLLAGHAEDILARIEQAESDFEAHRGEVVGQLRIGAFPTALRGLAPAALRTLADRYPRLTIEMQEIEPLEAVRDIARGSMDIAIVQDRQSLPLAIPERIARAPLADDVADLAVPSTHPLAGRRTVKLRDVMAEPWIASPPGAVCYDLLVQTIRSYDTEPRIVHVADEYQTQLALVGAGLGLGILPRLGRTELPGGVAVLCTDPALVRSVYAIWREPVAALPTIRAAVTAFQEAAHPTTDG